MVTDSDTKGESPGPDLSKYKQPTRRYASNEYIHSVLRTNLGCRGSHGSQMILKPLRLRLRLSKLHCTALQR